MHIIRLVGMQGNTLPNPSTILYKVTCISQPKYVCCPSNTCRATSAVSRWVDGVATQFVALTKSSCERVVQQQFVCMATMHECMQTPPVSCSDGQIGIRYHLDLSPRTTHHDLEALD
jgi:hypothetical protein